MSNSALFLGFSCYSSALSEGLLCCFYVFYCYGPVFVSDQLQNLQWSSFCQGPVLLLSTVNVPSFVRDNLV